MDVSERLKKMSDLEEDPHSLEPASNSESSRSEDKIASMEPDIQDQSILSSSEQLLEEEEPHPNSFVKLTNLSKTFGRVPSEQHAALVELTRPHRDSFDWLINHGLYHVARDLPPVEFALKNGCRVGLDFQDIKVDKPFVPVDEKVCL